VELTTGEFEHVPRTGRRRRTRLASQSALTAALAALLATGCGAPDDVPTVAEPAADADVVEADDGEGAGEEPKALARQWAAEATVAAGNGADVLVRFVQGTRHPHTELDDAECLPAFADRLDEDANALADAEVGDDPLRVIGDGIEVELDVLNARVYHLHACGGDAQLHQRAEQQQAARQAPEPAPEPEPAAEPEPVPDPKPEQNSASELPPEPEREPDHEREPANSSEPEPDSGDEPAPAPDFSEDKDPYNCAERGLISNPRYIDGVSPTGSECTISESEATGRG
jgi:hypothetical protein